MKKYTFILQFRGGTYISQVNGLDIEDAVNNWAKSINIHNVQYFGKSSKKELIELAKEIEPGLITGTDNVWCITGILKVGFFIAYAIS